VTLIDILKVDREIQIVGVGANPVDGNPPINHRPQK